MSHGLLPSFLGALQASLSVLLVIFYGVIASQFGLLDKASSKKISSVGVRLFLPALLITKIGKELSADNVLQYAAILIWALAYNILSLCVGLLSVRLFSLPTWLTPAIAFNNTTSLPLLLVQSLDTTGVLDRLLINGDTVSDAVSRAQSYFLVCAIVGNCLTFAVGPRLIDGEHAPDEENNKQDPPSQQGAYVGHGEDTANEQTSLLPDRVHAATDDIEHDAYARSKKKWDRLSPRSQNILSFLSDFINAPLIGAVIGTIIGLVPALHKAFFNDSFQGGIFTAWLTKSLQNVGSLFVSLQVVVVGVSLSSALRKMKRGENSGHVPWSATLFILTVRFILWPVVSISIIYAVAKNTNALDGDPILWFAMMLMPAGPPAMKLIAMAEVNGASEIEKMVISKLLVVCYALSPILVFTIVGALTACEAAVRS